VDVGRSDLLPGSTALDRLGVARWNKSSNWRSSGFYGHYTTYAEVLQLIASLVFGLIVALLAGRKRESTEQTVAPSPLLRFSRTPLLIFSLAAICLALLLTVTRASQLAFLISAFVIVLIGGGRKWVFAAAVIFVPIAFAGLLFLQQSRQVGFFDAADDSIRWRQTVWREGVDLWTESPRNFILGVGMDSIKRYKEEWHLFDDGRLPVGHFHSTPLNLVVERGLPALLLWLAILGIYARSLWRGIRSNTNDPVSLGILLGCLGGTIGFFASGMVHYNLGDQEVAMVFFLMMGLGLKTVEFTRDTD
jgi:O-antigen ligase